MVGRMVDRIEMICARKLLTEWLAERLTEIEMIMWSINLLIEWLVDRDRNDNAC